MAGKTRDREVRKDFSRKLLKLRRLRGYPTAYRFFHSPRKASGLGISFQQYLRIEKGERLPSTETLKEILDALGLVSKLFAERDELVRLYVRASMGGDAIFDQLLDVHHKAVAPAEPTVADLALRERFAAIPDMSVDQAISILSDTHRFWFFEWLLHTGKCVTAAEAAVQFGTSELDAVTALEMLVSENLLVRRKKGFASPFYESDVGQPLGVLTGPRIRWVQNQINDRLKKGGAKQVYGYHFMTVEGSARVQQTVAMMRKTSHQTYLFRESRETLDPRFVCVEFRVSDIEAIPGKKT